jgi:hypothetical protein
MAQKTRDENQTLSGNAEPFFESGKNETWNAHQKCVFLNWGPDNICTTEQCEDCAVFQLAREKMAQATQTGDLGNDL